MTRQTRCRRLGVPVLLLAVLALVLAACGGGSGAASRGASGQGAPEAEETTVAAATTMSAAEGERIEQPLDRLPTAPAASVRAQLATVEQQGTLTEPRPGIGTRHRICGSYGRAFHGQG